MLAFKLESASPSHSNSSLVDLTQSLLKVCRRRPRVTRAQETTRCHHCIKSTSGPTRTHSVLDGTTTSKHGRLAHRDKFVCSGAVDVVKLLYLARRALFAMARDSGGNVLLDEQWSCEISHPKFRKQDRFKVSIQYSATVGRSCWPDAQRPVQLEEAKGIPGLMTVLDRAD